jgi:DNA-binding transcriptional MocR family regulator
MRPRLIWTDFDNQNKYRSNPIVVCMRPKIQMLKYAFVEEYIRDLIARGIIREGAKLPSIRKLAHQMGYSPITVQHAYELLVADGVIIGRPRSGYVASGRPALAPRLPEPITTGHSDGAVADFALQLVGSSWAGQALQFGSIDPGEALIQPQAFSRLYRATLRHYETFVSKPSPPEGNLALRTAIARRLAERGVAVEAEQVVITGRGMQGLELSLGLLASPGDAVIAETPTYPPLILALRARGLKVIELYSHPEHGVDPDQLLYLLTSHRVRLAVLSPINHFPTGVNYPPDARERIARIVESHSLPLIEFDIFAELAHRDYVRWPIMHYGGGKSHLLFGSFGHVVGRTFGLGFVVCRSGAQALCERKYLVNQHGSDEALEAALASYVARGDYHKELGRLRRRLLQQNERGLARLGELLPTGFAPGRPAGGYMSWVRGPTTFDALTCARRALAEGFGLAPGPIFSPSAGLPNHLGINLSGQWALLPPNDLSPVNRLLTHSGS